MVADEGDDLSTLFQAIQRGEAGAEKRLYELVYGALRKIAHGRLRSEPPEGTLQTTALVHEAYLKLSKGEEIEWENRRHFFGAAARAMRQILVDRARRRNAHVHGGDAERVPLEDDVPDAERPAVVLALDEALEKLARERPRHAEVVHCRYYLGLTVGETGDLLRVSPSTVEADWRFARSWLRREIGDSMGRQS